MRWLLSFLLLTGLVTAVAASNAVAVSNIRHKVVEGPDFEGDLLVSVQASVRNLLDSEQEVEVWIQALDKEGFEVTDVKLTGHFTSNQDRVLTDTVYISEKAYETIVKWQVEE